MDNLDKDISIKDLRDFIGYKNTQFLGNINNTFNYAGPIDTALEKELTFYKGDNLQVIIETNAKIIICGNIKISGEVLKDKTLIIVDNPRLWFIKCVKHFIPRPKKTGIHPTAIIGEKTEIGENVCIGPNVYIEDEVSIGENSTISIGTKIFNKTIIGSNVTIQPGTVIGSDGFGYERNEDGSLEKFPSLGGVVIEDDVEIGSNTCIDRGSLSDTIIGKGTKIDNLVHIAHNVKIGKNCLIICLSCISGSVELGDNSWIAPLAVIKNGLKIGSNVIVGMGAVVIRDVPDNDVVAGVPAKSLKKGKHI